MAVCAMGRIRKKDTDKAESRWLFSDLGFKGENGVGKGQNKYKGNPGVQMPRAFTLKSKGAEPKQNI